MYTVTAIASIESKLVYYNCVHVLVNCIVLYLETDKSRRTSVNISGLKKYSNNNNNNNNNNDY